MDKIDKNALVLAENGLIISNYKNEQIKEIIFLYKRDINPNQIIKIDKTAQNSAGVFLLNDKYTNVLPDWNLIRVVWINKRVDLDVQDMIDFNFDAKKLIKEESFYGLKDQKGLEAVLGTVNQEFFGMDVNPTLIDKATYIWYKIARKQFFHNGNKRTAMLAAINFLKMNFLDFNITDELKLYNKTVEIAEGKVNQENLKKYILDNTFINLKKQKKLLFNHYKQVLLGEVEDEK